MALLFKFNTPKPKQFHYRPMYYDERKERLEKMKAEARAAEKESSCGNLQKGFLNERRKSSKLHGASLEKKSALRFMVILLILLLILYFLMPELFYSFWATKD